MCKLRIKQSKLCIGYWLCIICIDSYALWFYQNARISHLAFLFTGQFGELNGQRSGRAEILIDDKYHYYLKVRKSDVSLMKS